MMVIIATIMGLLLGTAIVYATVAVMVAIYPWLTQNLGVTGAITACVLLATNMHVLLVRRD